MAPTTTPPRATKNIGKTKDKPKEKLFHPLSRKAGQLERKNLRTNKLASAASKRSRTQTEKNERNIFFKFALPPDVPCITLPEIHEIIRDIWLPRHDTKLEAEQAARRKGRPKSMKEDQISSIKEREAEEYRTGLEIPDLTHPPTVEFLRKWQDADPSYLHLLRWIQVSSSQPNNIVVVSLGINELKASPINQASLDVIMS